MAVASAAAAVEGAPDHGDPTRVTGVTPGQRAVTKTCEDVTSFAARRALRSRRWPMPRNRTMHAAAELLQALQSWLLVRWSLSAWG